MIFSHKSTFSHSDWPVQTKNTTGADITTYRHEPPDQKARFFQLMISPQSSSKSQIIHLFLTLLFAIEDTTILKSTKSSKSNTKSYSDTRFYWHASLCITAWSNIRIFEDKSRIRLDKPMDTDGLTNPRFVIEYSNIRIRPSQNALHCVTVSQKTQPICF